MTHDGGYRERRRRVSRWERPAITSVRPRPANAFFEAERDEAVQRRGLKQVIGKLCELRTAAEPAQRPQASHRSHDHRPASQLSSSELTSRAKAMTGCELIEDGIVRRVSGCGRETTDDQRSHIIR